MAKSKKELIEKITTSYSISDILIAILKTMPPPEIQRIAVMLKGKENNRSFFS